MDIQKALVTKLMETGDVRTLRLYNLQADHFTSEEARTLLKFVLEHHKTTGSMPSQQLAQNYAPEIEFVETTDTMETLCLHVAHELADADYMRLLVLSEELRQKHGALDAAGKISQEFLSLLSRYGKTDTYLVGSRPDAEYKQLTSRDEQSTRVVPYVWPALQRATGGHQGGQVVVVYGRLKHGKTWALLEQAHFVAARLKKRVLFISPEMPANEIYRRCYALECRFDYSRMVNQDLFYAADAGANKVKLARAIYRFNRLKTLHVHSAMDDDRELTIDLLYGLIEKFRPDYLAVDQLQELATNERQREERHRLGKIVQGFKRIGMKEDLPVMATTQRNRVKGKVNAKDDDADDISEADKIGQKADLAIRLRLNKGAQVRYFDVAAAREVMMDGWATHAQLCTNMGEIPRESVVEASTAPRKPPKIPSSSKKLFGGKK